MRRLLLTPISLLLGSAIAVSPLVELDYASYQGNAQDNGITSWLGIRYAAPPLGDLRFSAPQPPLPESDIVQANSHGPICLSTGTHPPSDYSNEDCLVMDIYAPTSADDLSALPIYFFIQGGGFNANSNANWDGSGLIKASGMNIIVITFNYRVGPYGFLASDEVLEGGSINNGLKDQRAALHWVQKYIRNFGGDPQQVTIGGDSAGAQSINLHLTAYGGRDDGLFARTAAESQSFSALRTVSESQFMYDNLTLRAGCDNTEDTLSCLRNLTTTSLQSINTQTPFRGAQDAPLYMYGPTLDYDFITDYTYRAYAHGAFVKLPALTGDDTNEGTIFTPGDTDSYESSNRFLHNQFPSLTPPQLQTLNILYPVDGTPSFPGKGRFWRQVSNAYGELRYTCSGIFVAQSYARFGVEQNYNYHWNVLDAPSQASGYGVSHTIETNAIFGFADGTHGGPQSYRPGGENYPIVPLTMAYWSSFIRSGDPNLYSADGAPEWRAWGVGGEGWQRLRFETNATEMESVPVEQRVRCAYCQAIGVELKQ